MRFGYTTGSCATAAAKAAAIGLFRGDIPDEVEIDTPAGIRLRLKILHKQLSNDTACCAVRKDAGDDPDVTNGCEVHARVERNVTEKIDIDGGEGIGRATKPGLQVPVCHAAINPVPRRMIENAVRGVIGSNAGARVVISVPNGRLLGERTFNSRLGIVGGISIIGTTGIVRPMSEDAFKSSLACGLDIARAMEYETVVLVPGSLGERAVFSLFDITKDQIVQMSNFVGFMLNEAGKRHFKKVILAGHPGKLTKLLRGDFNTHSTVSSPANDILLNIIQTTNPPNALINSLMKVSTVEGMIELLRDCGELSIMNEVAERVESAALEFYRHERPFDHPEAGVILFDMKGSIIGISDSAKKWQYIIKTRSSSLAADRD